MGYSPQGTKEWDLTEHEHTHRHTHTGSEAQVTSWTWVCHLKWRGLVRPSSYPVGSDAVKEVSEICRQPVSVLRIDLCVLEKNTLEKLKKFTHLFLDRR